MSGEVCNIGPQEIKKRQKIGFVLIIIAGFTSGMLIALHVQPVMRLIVFPIFAAGFVSLLQAQKKVCVHHAWKKTKNMN
ncbi:MAG: hypothetical protein FJY86_02530 [Candidatus Diapherotrites archaeon]|uniref:DUF2892 domain-containing protein n=1 Tax=Candidatus Iainarchaeum sp. TaxID=3101447 RepID=A0A8T4C6K6_9ARCH|nr:hypothetical protein [Candidatus Diapherotrites archaeon]